MEQLRDRVSLAEFEKFYQTIEQKLLYDEPSMLSTKKEEANSTSVLLNQSESLLYKSSTGLAAKEKLYKVMALSTASEAQKATARTVIEEVVDKLIFEIQRLQDLLDSYDSRIQKDKKAIKSENEKINEFVKEIEKREIKINEMLKENKSQNEQLKALKDNFERGKNIWELEKRDLIPKLEQETNENKSNLQRIEQQMLIITELERQNSELKELAEKRYKSFIQLQEQQRTERADQVAFMRIQTEHEGMKKKLTDLEEFIRTEEIEFKTRVEQLSELNENLVEECKTYKKRVKELEEEKWRANINTDINENMFDNSFIKESIIKINQEDILNRSKKLNASIMTSPVISNQNTESLAKKMTLELVDMDSKIKPKLFRNMTPDQERSLHMSDNEALSSDNEINLTIDNIKDKKVTEVVDKFDFTCQTDRSIQDIALGFNEGAELAQNIPEPQELKPVLVTSDLFMRKLFNSSKLHGVDMSTQADISTKDQAVSCDFDDTDTNNGLTKNGALTEIDFFGEPTPYKLLTTIQDIQTLINHRKKLRQLKIYGYTSLILNSKVPEHCEIQVQTDEIQELSIIEPDRKSPSIMADASYFDASQAFIENLNMFDKKSEDLSPKRKPQYSRIREINKPLLMLNVVHQGKQYDISAVNKNTDLGVYYFSKPSDDYHLSIQYNTMSHSMLMPSHNRHLYEMETIQILSNNFHKIFKPLDIRYTIGIVYQPKKTQSANKVYETQNAALFSRESTKTMDTVNFYADSDLHTIEELRAQIIKNNESYQKELNELYNNYQAEIQATVNKLPKKTQEFDISDIMIYIQSKEENIQDPIAIDIRRKSMNEIQPAVFTLNSYKSVKNFDYNAYETIINQESHKQVLTMAEPSIIYNHTSEQNNKLDVDLVSELTVQKDQLEQEHIESIVQLKQNHENTISKITTELGQKIQLIEQEFKKRNQFLETEFNNRLTQLKTEKNQEIEELNQELTTKKTEVKDKRDLKRQLDQLKMEIDQLKTERDSYVYKLEQLIKEKEELEVKQDEIINTNDKNNEEYKVKLQEQIINNKKIHEQLRILQEAKRKADNRCMSLQAENVDLERQVSELKAPKPTDPFEDFNLEATRIQTQRTHSERDIINEMQMMRRSTLSTQQPIRNPSTEVTPIKKLSTLDLNFNMQNNQSQISSDNDRKKFRLSFWGKTDERSQKDISLYVDNNVINQPVSLRKPDFNISPNPNPINRVVKVKEISHILLQKKPNEKDEYVEKAKTYSYDYINIRKCFGILEIIQTYQNLKNADEWFTDILYRLNSWTNKKKKILVITEQNIFIFNTKTSLKRRINLSEIIKLKHSHKNNYIGISARNIEEEVLETYRKEEMILFLKKKMKNLGLGLSIVEQTNFAKRNRLNDEAYYNPNIMKKFKPHYTQTFSLAAHNHQIGYITTEAKELFGLVDTSREFLCLLTNMGIICFSRKEFKVSDFIPLVGSKVLVSERSNLNLKLVLCDCTERTLAFNSANDKNAWYDMLNKNIKKLVERLS